MPRLEDFVEVNICNSNKKHYISKGYNIEKNGKYIVSFHDLPIKSNVMVLYSCDYCGKEHYKRNSDIKSDSDITCCRDCCHKKTLDIVIERYGVANIAHIEGAKEKKIATNLEKYGSEYTVTSAPILQKIKEKSLSIYGFEYPMQSEYVKSKIRKRNIELYGVDYPMQNKLILEKINKKRGTGIKCSTTSKQQIKICEILNGCLNYKIGKYYADIVIKQEYICIEYDGGGHDLSVKLGKMTKEEFQVREVERENFIISSGYKIIRIISENDISTNDNDILFILETAKKYFDKYNIFRYNLESKIFICE